MESHLSLCSAEQHSDKDVEPCLPSMISKVLVHCSSKPCFFPISEAAKYCQKSYLFLSPLAFIYTGMQFDTIYQNSALCQ